jgi:hypothetical protein
MVRLACTKCERRGQYRKATLIERYGPDKNMVDLRPELAAGCPKIAAGNVMDCAASIIPAAAMKAPRARRRALGSGLPLKPYLRNSCKARANASASNARNAGQPSVCRTTFAAVSKQRAASSVVRLGTKSRGSR